MIYVHTGPVAGTHPKAQLEVTRSHLWARAGRREVFIQWRTGLPLREFARERSGADTQLWGLGTYVVISRT